MRPPHNRLPVEAPPAAAPPAPPTGLSPSGFMLLPLVSPSEAQLELYRWAMAQAQAVVRPSILERDRLGHWN